MCQLLGRAQTNTNLQLYLAFIDFTKAYDNINWDALWQVFCTYGVLTHFISLLEDLHLGTHAAMWLGGHLGRNFPITNGVRQGCVVAPLLFNVSLDFIVKEALRALPNCGVEIEFWSGGELVYTPGSGPLSLATIAVMLYVDDMVLFSTNVGKLVDMLRVVDFWASEMAMCINVTKTKIMSLGRGAPQLLVNTPIHSGFV
jgi:hypothetical protein